ncbi:protein bfr2-like [Triticum aestivum]|uniref:protein bfr2-like n=1 Tax=Triticum aestivum TaxID=4565 RepID=UPI001D022BB5|nr:protein bfr2-like [Triticum aestivum]
MDHVTQFVAARLPESYDKTKQKKLPGMVHEMCSTISHVVGKLVSGIGRIDDAQEGTRRSEAVRVEKSRQEPTRRSKQAPAARESLSSEEESFKTHSEEDASDSDKIDGDIGDDGSDSDGHSRDDDGDDFVVENVGCNDNEVGEATFHERGAAMDESKEDTEDEEEEEEKKTRMKKRKKMMTKKAKTMTTTMTKTSGMMICRVMRETWMTTILVATVAMAETMEATRMLQVRKQRVMTSNPHFNIYFKRKRIQSQRGLTRQLASL